MDIKLHLKHCVIQISNTKINFTVIIFVHLWVFESCYWTNLVKLAPTIKLDFEIELRPALIGRNTSTQALALAFDIGSTKFIVLIKKFDQ